MNDPLKLKEGASCNMIRNRDFADAVLLEGTWITEHWRQRKSGTLYLKEIYQHKNTITNPARAKLLDTMFNFATQDAIGNWVAGLVNATPTPNYGLSDTMAVKGWTEWVAYDATSRPVWGQGPASGTSVTNATPIQFAINGGGSVHGLFITNIATKNGTTGLLWSASPYTSPVAVVPSDQIRSTYSLSA